MENTAHVDVAQSNMCAWFHTSGVQCKKGKKSKQSEDHAQPEQQQVHGTAEASIQMDFEEEHDEEMDKDHEEGDLVNIEKYTRRMHRAIEIFNTSVQKIRGAMPSSSKYLVYFWKSFMSVSLTIRDTLVYRYAGPSSCECIRRICSASPSSTVIS